MSAVMANPYAYRCNYHSASFSAGALNASCEQFSKDSLEQAAMKAWGYYPVANL